MMYALNEQLAATAKSNVDIALTAMHTAFVGVERLAAVNLGSARAFAEERVASTKALLDVKDMHEFAQVQSAMLQPAMESILNYVTSMYGTYTQTQQEFATLFETRLAEMNKSAAAMLDKSAKNAPAGTDIALAAVKSAMAAANSAYDTMSKAVRQAAEIAETNLAAVGSASIRATNGVSAAPKMRKAA